MTYDDKIEQILKVFYNGDSLPEEEELLLKFFNSKNLDEKWHIDRDIFIALYDSSEITLPDSFSERLENRIDKHISGTNIPKNLIPHKKIPLPSKVSRLFISVASSAACILLCIVIFFVSDSYRLQDRIVDTYNDPKEAAIVAEQTLKFVSTKLNKGLSQLDKVKESVDKTNELLKENFK